MKYNFKVGDKVRCINKSANTNSQLRVGKIYTITDVYDYGKMIRLAEEINCGAWSSYQFESVDIPRKDIKMCGLAKFCMENYK